MPLSPQQSSKSLIFNDLEDFISVNESRMGQNIRYNTKGDW